jgi:hypothetical protein
MNEHHCFLPVGLESGLQMGTRQNRASQGTRVPQVYQRIDVLFENITNVDV